ncbi:peroxidase 1-like [Nymphaea colorata]|nr:peroxidase 1-like [Nymphaea colorata]
MAVGKCLLFLLPLVVLLLPSGHAAVSLKIGFYNTSCPSAESIVRAAVASAVAANPGIAAGLIRMHFHDCFVRGCDASVLLNSTNGDAERDSPPNASLRGFEIINAAKTQLESTCPNTVSCADILAFAARDSAALVGNISYQVPSGRRDGLVSNSTEALLNLPPPSSNISDLVTFFSNKNLTERDMVVLSGAHSIGVAHCASFTARLYNSSSPTGVDPTLDAAYAARLRAVCPNNTAATDPTTVNMDTITPNVLDINYYVGLNRNLGLFTSDHALLTSNTSLNIVNNNLKNATKWAQLFAQAMVKMGKIQPITGKNGQIRKNCALINPSSIELVPEEEGSQVAAS